VIDTTGRFKDPVRNVDMEFTGGLEVLDQTIRPMPGSWVTRRAVDPRLSHANAMVSGGQSVGPKEVTEIPLYESVALLRHRPSQTQFIAFRETMDQLMREQKDPVKYPEWLIKHPVKKTELQIHIAEVTRKPAHRDDRQWMKFLEETDKGNQLFDSICYFLLTKHIITQEMYGRP
jgi:hypothetical protein